MKAIVRVDLKPGVLDPQGRAVAHALQGLGYPEVTDARQGKVIELDLTGVSKKDAEARVKAMCEALLANTVIERYRVTMEE